MDLVSAQGTFVQLLGQLRPECKLEFLEWVHKEYNPKLEPGNGTLEESKSDLWDSIASDLRGTVPLDAMAPGEQTLVPTQGQNSELLSATTLHVDSFLYPTEEDVDTFCSQKGVSTNYCLNCGSWKTAPLNLISHSMSREQLKFIFSDLLPNLTGKTVLDIGSRLGPVLYGGFLYSQASRLIGVEMNSYFCELQLQVVAKYGMGGRVQVVCSDICQQVALLQEADVIVMNNVFEAFLPLEDQARVWEFLHRAIRKPGLLLVTIPSIQESWSRLPLSPVPPLGSWVREVLTGVDPTDEELSMIHLYCVL